MRSPSFDSIHLRNHLERFLSALFDVGFDRSVTRVVPHHVLGLAYQHGRDLGESSRLFIGQSLHYPHALGFPNGIKIVPEQRTKLRSRTLWTANAMPRFEAAIRKSNFFNDFNVLHGL